MVFNSESWNLAQKFRGTIASEYLKYHGETNAQAGRTLVFFGNNKGFTPKRTPVHGKTLLAWKSGDNVPYWAVQTMLTFIIAHGFNPDSEQVLDSIVVLLCKDLPDEQCEAYLRKELREISGSELAKSLERVRV